VSAVGFLSWWLTATSAILNIEVDTTSTSRMIAMMNAKLAATVVSLRKSRGWTQEHLAQVADLSVRTVQRVEDQGTASAETLLALASAFDVDVKTLREGGEQGSDGPVLLVRVVQERQLELLMGCHATLLDHDEPQSDTEREQIGSFFTSVRDWNDIWSDLSPADHLDAAHSMLKEVRALEALGLWTFALQRTEKKRFPNGTSMDWEVSTVVVQRSDNPAIIKLDLSSEKTP
jgi:transcriptional regulator with XRE-family HTH domain